MSSGRGRRPERGRASRRRPIVLAGGVGVALVVAGCGSNGQSTLAPASRASREISDLWWVMLIGSAIVFGVVLLLVAIAVLRRRSEREGDRRERRARRLVLLGGVALPLLALPSLFGLVIHTLPATSAPKTAEASLTVHVVGHQFFWAISYDGSTAVTANELHIPAGETVRVDLATADVIHSFWVPELNKKVDTIPGRDNGMLLRADRPGVYRGQCAELCGVQHAHMSFFVFADPPARFRAWLANMSLPRREPATALERRGEGVFLSAGCGGCHTIRGTEADGKLGPDLTHLATRRTLASGTIPNGKGWLGGWILDPQHVKPGNRMPGFDLSGPQLQALLDYLTSLR